jgi:ribose 5-phosphate isomerase
MNLEQVLEDLKKLEEQLKSKGEENYSENDAKVISEKANFVLDLVQEELLKIEKSNRALLEEELKEIDSKSENE